MKLERKLLPTALLIGLIAAGAEDVPGGAARPAPATAAAAATAPARGTEPAADRMAAAAAFDSGDYLSAVQLYTRTREDAARSGDDRAWIADTVAMARAYLYSGVPARARQLLAEFNQRFSMRDSGGLEGEILVAEGRIREAENFFEELLADDSVDGRTRGEAALAQAYLKFQFGGAKDKAAALKTLEELEGDQWFGTEARLRRIHALIVSGQPRRALELIEQSSFSTPEPQRQLKLLRLLALLYAGRSAEFDAGWKELGSELPPRPDKLVFDTLDLAAELAMKNSQPETAERYWNCAYGFADRDAVRRDVLRKLFNACAAIDAGRAAAAAKRYLELFPTAADPEQQAERAQILTGAGRLLSAAGDHSAALEFFRTVVLDSKAPLEYRHSAARDAALSAEQLKDNETAKRCFEFLVSTARDERQRHFAQVFYAEYLLRRRDHSGAEQLLRSSAGAADPQLADRAGIALTQALLKQDKAEAALTEAEKLRRSADPAAAGAGSFYAALAYGRLGRRAEARKGFLDYAKRSPQGEFVRQARFGAADMALDLAEYRAAADEFRAYSEAYPDAPDAVTALQMAMRAGCLGGDWEFAAALLPKLLLIPGASQSEYCAAALQLADLMRRSGKAAEALTLLDKLDTAKYAAAEKALLELMRARLLVAARRRDDAIKCAEQLLRDHPGAPAAADAAFLAGELYLGGGAPDKALAMFVRARELRPSGFFGEAAAVRAAECRVESFLQKGGKDDLQAAAAEYSRIADTSTIPSIRLMCKYKLGWCREKQNDPQAAVREYHQALLYAAELKRARRTYDPKWCSRSAYAALCILLGSGWPDADQQGARIIEAAKKLELPGGDAEFETVREEFQQRYMDREK